MGLRTQSCGRAPGRWDLIISRNCPSYHLTVACFFVFRSRISFLVGSSSLSDGYSPVSCDFGVFVREGELFLSAILFPPKNILNVQVLFFTFLTLTLSQLHASNEE